MSTAMRPTVALLAAGAALAAGTVAASAATDSGPACRPWTVTTRLGNDTGQTVRIISNVGSLSRGRVLRPGAHVPFRAVLPGAIRRKTLVFATASLDYSGGVHPLHGWRFTDEEVVARPAAACN